jgi:hypothetical protein
MDGGSCRLLLVFILLALATRWSQGQAGLTRQPPQVGNVAETPPQVGVRRVPAPVVPTTPRRPQAIAFRRMVHAAGIIFSGTVTNIEQRPTSGSPLETVAITFHVENAIRGASPGENLTISQWIGLWSSGQRYRVGERVTLFLYPASKLGLTSSVSGPMGRFEMDAAHHVLISEQHRWAFRDDPVLAGKSRVTVREFALAVRKANETEPLRTRDAHDN